MSSIVPPPASILFIAVSRIGDTLFATPAIRAVAQAFPAARITVLGHPKRAEVFEHVPFIHEVGAITKQRAPWRGRLSGRRFDLAFVCGFDAPLVAYGLRVAERVVAFEQKDAPLTRRLFAAVPPPAIPRVEHAVHELLHLPAAVGVEPASLRIAFGTSADERVAAKRRLDEAGVGDGSPLVGLQVASFPTKAFRDWPIERFADLCERISARWPQARFAIFGGAEERRRTEWLKAQLGTRAALFAGRLTLRQTAAIMAQTDVYVGVDTGPTHIMSAFDIPLVAMYHSSSPAALTGPLDHPCAYVIDHPAAREDETATMADIAVETVFAKVEQALAEHPPARR